MKKSLLLNAELSHLIACLGHTDAVSVADAGLPISPETKRIDLALTHGVPSLMQVVQSITAEMQVEAVLMAEEFAIISPELHRTLLAHIAQLAAEQGREIAIEYVPHDTFKVRTRSSRAVVRSGECTPYANVIFYSGVVF